MLQYYSYNHTLHTDTYTYTHIYYCVYYLVADKSGKKKISYPNLAQACSAAAGPLILAAGEEGVNISIIIYTES